MGTAIQKKVRQFSATYLIKTVSECFEKISDHRPNQSIIPFANFPKSAFAMMHQKCDSLLAFDEERLDEVCCHNLEKLYHVDGTGLYYSGTCRCDDCCIMNEGKKNEAYYHNIMGGCIVHPNQKTVIPLAPEAICKQDGTTKNDCEKAAIRRFLVQVKHDHPRLKPVILLDGLYADNPTIALIRKYGWHYIIVAKDGNHVSLIEAMNELYEQGEVKHHQ